MTENRVTFIESREKFLELRAKILPLASFDARITEGLMYYTDDRIINTNPFCRLFTDLMGLCDDDCGYIYGLDSSWVYNKYKRLPMLKIPKIISDKEYFCDCKNNHLSKLYEEECELVGDFRLLTLEYIVFPESIRWYIYANSAANVARLVTTVGIPEWYSFYAEDKEEIEDCENQIKEYLDTIAKNPPMKTKDPWDEADIIS